MSDTPLPQDVSFEDLGEDYILVPYALQFGDEDQPMPVGCIVCDRNKRKLDGYILGANGSWSNVGEEHIDENSELFGNTSDSLYQSIIGVAGNEWSKLRKLKSELSQFIDVDSKLESELVNLAEEFEGTNFEFCSCSDPDSFEDSLMKISDKLVTVSVCKECGKTISASGWKSEENVFRIDSASELHTISTIEDVMSAENIKMTEMDDLYMYTQSGSEVNSLSGIASVIYWESQKQNSESRAFVPTENNITAICRDEEIIGVIIWSYLFSGLVTIQHLGLFDISDEELEECIRAFSEDESTEIYIKKPYQDTRIDEFVIPIDFASGSVQMASKSNSN